MSLEEQQKIEAALKKNREESALSLEDQELLLTVKSLGISNKQGLLNVLKNTQSTEQQNQYKPNVSESPYNSQIQTEKQNSYVDPRIIQIIKKQDERIALLEKDRALGDVKSKVLTFLKDHADKYVFAASLPHVQDVIADHYSDILLRGEKYSLEEVVSHYEKQEIDKYNIIKKKENEKGGELYPLALGGTEHIKEKAEALSKAQEEGEKKEGEGEKALDSVLTEKEKQALDAKNREQFSKLKEERELNTNIETPEQKKPKINLSENVSAVTVDELVQKHGFETKTEPAQNEAKS